MEESQAQTPEQIQHESNKVVRENLAFAHYILCNQVKWMAEQFQDAKNAIDVLAALCHDLQAKIEAVEPPAPKAEAAPKKPYVVDVPMTEVNQ